MNYDWLHSGQIKLENFKDIFNLSHYSGLNRRLNNDFSKSSITFQNLIQTYDTRLGINEIEITKTGVIRKIADSLAQIDQVYVIKIINSFSQLMRKILCSICQIFWP